MRKLLFITLLIGNYLATAQNARVKQYTAPLAGTVVLRDVEDNYNAQVINTEAPVPDAGKLQLMDIKKQVAVQFPYKRANVAYKTTATAAPIVEKGYVADSFTGIPPDNDMAISKAGKAVSVVNSMIAITDDALGKMTFKRGLKTFSNAVGLNDFNDYRYDPKIMYDPEADRFICVMLNAINELNYIVLGFSKTNDPAGQWNFYKFYGNYNNDTTWFDYPSIAITKNEFFLTGNKIKFNASWQAGFAGTVIYQVNKQDGYNAVSNISYQIWDSINMNGIQIRNLYPAKGGSAILGPSQYFLSNRNFDVQNDTVFLVKIPDVISSGNTTLDIKVLTSPTKYGVPPDGRQPDTSVTLATNDGRVLGAYIDGDEIQFVSTTVSPGSGSAGIFHGIIKDFATSPVFKHTQILSVDTMDFGYPNITYAGNPWGLRQSLISFNYTGPNINPGMGAMMFDGVGYSPITLVKTGTGSIKRLTSKQQRWGDYMGSQVDWNNIGTVWIEGIYGRSDNDYGNWMAKLNSPLLSINKKQTFTESKIYPNPSVQLMYFEFTLSEQTNLVFAIYDMQGKMVDKVLEQTCKKGANRLQINIASLPAGNYTIQANAADGKAAMVQTFTKQ